MKKLIIRYILIFFGVVLLIFGLSYIIQPPTKQVPVKKPVLSIDSISPDGYKVLSTDGGLDTLTIQVDENNSITVIGNDLKYYIPENLQ